MRSKLFPAAAFVVGAAFAACPEIFGTDTTTARASAPVSALALPAVGTGAKGRQPIELGQVRTFDTSTMTWAVEDR